jgi:hypothetical protein
MMGAAPASIRSPPMRRRHSHIDLICVVARRGQFDLADVVETHVEPERDDPQPVVLDLARDRGRLWKTLSL